MSYLILECENIIQAYPAFLWGTLLAICIASVFSRLFSLDFGVNLLSLTVLNAVAASNFWFLKPPHVNTNIFELFFVSYFFLPPTGLLLFFVSIYAMHKFFMGNPIDLGAVSIALIAVFHGLASGLLLYIDQNPSGR